jgi:hypothetical protein
MSISFSRIQKSVALSLALLFLTPALPAHGVTDGTVNCGTSGTFTIASNIVTTNDLCVGSLTIPEGVTQIAADAFNRGAERSSYITSITFPDSLRTIQQSAFRRAYLLTNINFGTGIQTIGHWNFADSTEITAVTIPSSVTSIGVGVFIDSLKLQDVSFLGNAPSVDQFAFLRVPAGAKALINSSATGFTSAGSTWNNLVVTLPAPPAYSSGSGSVNCGTSGYFTAASYVVTGNSSCAGSAVIPSGITSIAEDAFTANASITSVTIPNTVLTIGVAAFYANTSLTTVTFAANSTLTTIGSAAFERTAITNIILPNSITSLGNYAFYQAANLTSITLPNALTAILQNTFDGCTGLTAITIPNSVVTFEADAFAGTTSLTSITYHGPASTTTLSAAGIILTALIADPITTANVVITAPIKNATPVTSLSSNGQFTTTITWSGSPTTFAAATAYTATATITPVNNYTLTGVSANFFTINGSLPTSANLVNAGVFTFLFPATAANPAPYLKTVAAPQLHLKASKLVCTPGMYNTGYTLSGVIDPSTTTPYSPPSFTYNLLLNGISQSSLTVTTPASSATWDMPVGVSGSVLSCSVTVSTNLLTNTDTSGGNTSGVSSALLSQTKATTAAIKAYKLALINNSKAYQRALIESRTKWRQIIDATRANFVITLERISADQTTAKMISDVHTAYAVMKSTRFKADDEYFLSRPKALEAQYLANELALNAKNAEIAKANAIYGAFIESIGYGVLIP